MTKNENKNIAMAKQNMNHNKIVVDGLKKKYAKIPTNPVANSMIYIADLLANLYDFLNIILKIRIVC